MELKRCPREITQIAEEKKAASSGFAGLIAADPAVGECLIKLAGERSAGKVKKGNQWYFGAKAHIGVDSRETVVHSVCTSAASMADKHMLPDLLHGDERKVWGDGCYQGQTEAIRAAASKAQAMTCRRTKYKDCVDEEGSLGSTVTKTELI